MPNDQNLLSEAPAPTVSPAYPNHAHNYSDFGIGDTYIFEAELRGQLFRDEECPTGLASKALHRSALPYGPHPISLELTLLQTFWSNNT